MIRLDRLRPRMNIRSPSELIFIKARKRSRRTERPPMSSEAPARVGAQVGAQVGRGRQHGNHGGTPVTAAVDSRLSVLLDRSMSFAGAADIAGPFLPQMARLSERVGAVLLYGS